MLVIKLTRLALETPGPARKVGEKLAEKVRPGDIIDLENDIILMSHSFWDGFFRKFIQIHREEKVKTLQFQNLNESMEALIKYVIKKKLGEIRRPKVGIKTFWKEFDYLSKTPFLKLISLILIF